MYMSALSWNRMVLNQTGGAPFSKAGVKSTSFGIMPLFSKVIMPLLISSSEIGGGFYRSSYSSKNIRYLASLWCFYLTIYAIDFLALQGPFLLLFEAVGWSIPAPFALSFPSGSSILPKSSSSGCKAKRAYFLDLFQIAGSLKLCKS